MRIGLAVGMCAAVLVGCTASSDRGRSDAPTPIDTRTPPIRSCDHHALEVVVAANSGPKRFSVLLHKSRWLFLTTAGPFRWTAPVSHDRSVLDVSSTVRCRGGDVVARLRGVSGGRTKLTATMYPPPGSSAPTRYWTATVSVFPLTPP